MNFVSGPHHALVAGSCSFIHDTKGDRNYPPCRKAGFQPRIVQEAFNSAGILGLVSCGMGITILTESIYDFATGRLVPLPISDITEVMVTEAVWASENLRLPTQHFVDFLETQDRR